MQGPVEKVVMVETAELAAIAEMVETIAARTG
jgi:hypothetical protein